MNQGPEKKTFLSDGSNHQKIFRHLPRAGLVLMTLGLVILAACAPKDTIRSIDEADIGFNDKLRPDLKATVSQKPPRFMDDPRDDPTVPATMLTHSTIPAESGCKLRQAHTLWVPEDGFPILSFEAVARNVVARGDGEKYTVDAIGGCLVRGSKEFMHPYTRTLPDIHPRGTSIAIAGGPPIGVELNACRGGDALNHPDNPPHALDKDCPVTDLRAIASSLRRSPKEMCMIGADLVNRGDVSYTLQAREIDNAGGKVLKPLPARLNAPPFTVLPHIKTVATTRKLARVMNSGDQQTDTYPFLWTVPFKEDRWEENFGPGLRVARVRAFTRMAGQRIDLSPARLEIGTFIHNLGLFTELDACRPPEGGNADDGFDLTACIDDDAVTPTYYHSWLAQRTDCDDPIADAQRLMWRFHFDPDRHPDGPPSPVYIEFELANTGIGVSGAGLRAQPGAKDFGDNRPGSTSNYPAAIRLINDGAAGMMVDTLFVQGPDAANFHVRPDTGALPFLLTANRFMGVRVEVTPRLNGAVMNASLVVEGRAGNQRQRIQAELTARGVAADLHAEPDTLDFALYPERPDAPPRNVDYVLLQNSGYIPLTRGRITLQGPDAQYFSVLGSRPGGGSSHSPPSLQEQLAPGQFDTLTIAYHPGSAGSHTAELRISSDAGDARVELSGYCQDQCQSSGPPFPSPGDLRRDLPEMTQDLDDELPAAVLTDMSYGATVTLVHLGLGEQRVGEREFSNLTCTDDNMRDLNASGLASRSHHGKGECRLTEKGRKVFQSLKKSPRFSTLFIQADAKEK